MVAAQAQPRFTEAEYLALERVAETKHEYCGGDIVAMAGAEPVHNQIVQNLRMDLGVALDGQPCRVTGGDQRVKVMATGEYFYPDVVITCLEPQYAEPHPLSLVNPQIIIEVLSPGTESRDRIEKWQAYQSIPTLTAYVLVSSDKRRVEHYRRHTEDGEWVFTVQRDGACDFSQGTSVVVGNRVYRLTDVD